MGTVEKEAAGVPPAQCPSCGTTRLRRRDHPDKIDKLEGNPFNRIQRVFGAQLYHCIYCRYQFYDMRGLAAPAPKVLPPKVELPEPAQVVLSKIPEVYVAPPEPQSSVSQSHIGRTVQVLGSMAVDEDLYIDGIFKGELAAPDHRVIVGPNARVEASISARELIVEGHLTGALQVACRVILHPAAIVHSNIRAGTIAIEDGASLRGNVTVEGSDDAGIEAEIENLAASIAVPDVLSSVVSVRSE